MQALTYHGSKDVRVLPFAISCGDCMFCNARGYEIFNEKQEGCRKVGLRPGTVPT
jgi:hypothetical protein